MSPLASTSNRVHDATLFLISRPPFCYQVSERLERIGEDAERSNLRGHTEEESYQFVAVAKSDIL